MTELPVTAQEKGRWWEGEARRESWFETSDFQGETPKGAGHTGAESKGEGPGCRCERWDPQHIDGPESPETTYKTPEV